VALAYKQYIATHKISNILPSQATPSFLTHVATNVREGRRRAKLSQKALAEASGVSIRMIGAVESGSTSLSTATLDRIAVALDLTLSDLVAAPLNRKSVVIDRLGWESDRGGVGVLRWSVDAKREVETWEWTLEPGDRYEAAADPEGWHVMLFVLDGQLTLEIDGKSIELSNTAHLLDSSKPHAFTNTGASAVRFFRSTVW
jgi:transcriptional regulator with XRE-family HTH domain